MARRSFGYPRYEEPQQQEVVGVPYISMYNPQDYQDYSKILEQGQQRYDVSQSAIAKYMEDYANAQVAERNIPALENIVQGRLKDIQTLVDKKYSGEYGNAANEIVQQLALARKPIMQAQVDYANEMKAREEFNRMQPTKYIRNPQTGKAELVPLSFEQYYQLKPSFNEEGRFTPTTFGPTRGRSEGDKWAMENISSPIMQQIKSGDLKELGDKFGDMAEVISQRGMNDADVDRYIENNASWIVPSFLQNSKWSKEEFTDEEGNIDYNLVKDYLKDIVKLQTVQSVQKEYRNFSSGNGDRDNLLSGLDTFAGIAGIVPKENIELARKELSGLSGRTALGESVFQTAVKLKSLPDRLAQFGYGLMRMIGVSAIKPASLAGVISHGVVAKQTEELSSKKLEEGINELENKVKNGTASNREKFLVRWLKDDTNVSTPLAQAALRYYNLDNPSKSATRNAIKSYIKDFSTKSVNPQIEIDYKDAKGNVDLKNLKGEDELFFGMNKDGAPTLTGAAVNTTFYDIETGEKLSGTDFIKKNENNPVQGFAKYSPDNPYSPGAKQIVVATKRGPRVYAMMPSKEKIAAEALPWLFHQAKYYPEQEAVFSFPNIKTGKEDKIQIVNLGKGKDNSNSEITVLVNGQNILDLVKTEGSPFTKGIITPYGGFSAEDIAYKYYTTYLKNLK